MEERGGGHLVRSGLATVQSVLKDLRSLFLPNRNQFKVLPPFWIVQLRNGRNEARSGDLVYTLYTNLFEKFFSLEVPWLTYYATAVLPSAHCGLQRRELLMLVIPYVQFL
ncbi:hypothetical protein VPH35_019272 [Triticum aestivum]